MLRAYLYVGAAGIVWLVEGFLFSRYLNMTWWQTALLGVLYVVLFALAVRRLVGALREHPQMPEDIAAWRVVTLAPMLVVIVGSFVSLPLILLVVALGKL